MITTPKPILTYAERVVLEEMFERLAGYELKIDEFFQTETGRWPQPSDKVSKIVEELGEVMQARKKGNRAEALDEMTDSVVACIGQALLLQYPTEQIINSLERTLQKLEARWGVEGHGKPTGWGSEKIIDAKGAEKK